LSYPEIEAIIEEGIDGFDEKTMTCCYDQKKDQKKGHQVTKWSIGDDPESTESETMTQISYHISIVATMTG
jgi:hypothetical protein